MFTELSQDYLTVNSMQDMDDKKGEPSEKRMEQNDCQDSGKTHTETKACCTETDAQTHQQTYCGIGTCRPSALQCFATLPKFTIIFSICIIFWAALNYYLTSQIPTLEKEFSISSTTSGTLVSALQYGKIATLLFVNHFGKRAHIPRLLSSFSFMLGVIAFVPVICELASLEPVTDRVFSSPLTNSSWTNLSTENDKFLCVSLNFGIKNASGENITWNADTAEANGNIPSRRWIMYALGITSVVIGTAGSAQIPLPVHYIDNNVKHPSQTALLTGMLYTAAQLGMPVALAIGTLTSRFPVHLDDSTLTPQDPRWIGAWWLGFVILGLCCIVFGIPVFFFPRKYQYQQSPPNGTGEVIPPVKQYTSQSTTDILAKEQQSTCPSSSERDKVPDNSRGRYYKKHESDELDQQSSVGIENSKDDWQKKQNSHLNGSAPIADQGHVNEKNLSDLFKDLPMTIIRILKQPVVLLLIIVGMAGSMMFAAFRTFASKYIMLQFNMPLWRANMYLSITGVTAAVLGTFIGGLITSRLKLARRGGLIVSFALIIPTVILLLVVMFLGCSNQVIVGYSSVVENETVACDCDLSQVLLSCGQDGRSYLSPCFAGCANVTGSEFTGCSNVEGGGSVTPGLCEFNCNTFVPFMVLMVAVSVFSALGIVPFVLTLLRCVEDRDKAVALAIFDIFTSLMGFLAGPIIFGKVIDRACLIWSHAATESGSCLLYDIEKLRFTVFGGLVGLQSIGSASLIAALIYDVCHERERYKKRKGIDNEVMTKEVLSEPVFMITKL